MATNYDCPICMSVCADGYTRVCGHMFHRKCILRQLNSTGDYRCAVCRYHWTDDDFHRLVLLQEGRGNDPMSPDPPWRPASSADLPVHSPVAHHYEYAPLGRVCLCCYGTDVGDRYADLNDRRMAYVWNRSAGGIVTQEFVCMTCNKCVDVVAIDMIINQFLDDLCPNHADRPRGWVIDTTATKVLKACLSIQDPKEVPFIDVCPAEFVGYYTQGEYPSSSPAETIIDISDADAPMQDPSTDVAAVPMQDPIADVAAMPMQDTSADVANMPMQGTSADVAEAMHSASADVAEAMQDASADVASLDVLMQDESAHVAETMVDVAWNDPEFLSTVQGLRLICFLGLLGDDSLAN